MAEKRGQRRKAVKRKLNARIGKRGEEADFQKKKLINRRKPRTSNGER